MKRTVVFIHDIGQTPACWNLFVSRYGACDYLCQAPAWPWLATTPVTESSTPGSGPSIKSVVDHYADWIGSMSFPPLLVGHGFGGLVIQLLLDRGLGAAGIALCPIPRRGHWKSLFPLPPPAPTLGAGDVPPPSTVMPRRLLLDVTLGIGTAIDYANDERGPLLLISAGKSRRVSSASVAACYRRHRRSMAITALRAFPHHGDWLIVEPGWEAVADATLDWVLDPE